MILPNMVKNIISLGLLQGVNYILPLITIPYLFRVLGAEQYGLVAFGYAFTQYFIIITDFGFNLSSVKYVSENRDNPLVVNNHVNSVILAKFLLSLGCLLIVILLVVSIEKFNQEFIFYISFFGMVLGNAAFPLWYFQGIERMKFITIINVLAKLLSVIPFFIFIHQPDDYYQVPIYYSLGYIISGIYSLYLVYYKIGLRFYFVKMSDVFDVLKESSGYFLSRASLSLFTTSNTFVLGLVCGNVFVGYYAIAEKLYQAYNSLISPINGVLFPHMAKTKDVSFFKKTLSRISVINVIFVLISIGLSGFIVKILYDTNNMHTLNSLKILLVTCIFTIPSILLGYPFLAALGHPKYTNLTVVLAAFVHIVGLTTLLLTGSITVESVSCMVLVTELCLFVFRLIGVRKYSLL
jgi:PST family polysaccharide transporter